MRKIRNVISVFFASFWVHVKDIRPSTSFHFSVYFYIKLVRDSFFRETASNCIITFRNKDFDKVQCIGHVVYRSMLKSSFGA